MSSRRYPTAELYEERQRDFYRNGNRSERSYDELDIDVRRSGDPRRSAPDFLREDYNRTSAGPLVVRKTEEEFSERGHRGRREVEQDTLVIRGGRRDRRDPSPPSTVRETEREEFTIRRSETERPRRREFDTDETDITIRRREQSRGPSRPPESVREVEREDITFRRGDGARPRPREVDIEREEVRFQERGPPRREEHRDEVIWRHDHREESRHGRDREVEKDTVVIRGRERSLPPPRSRGELVAREREEFVVRRREHSPPSPRRDVIKDEIIIRRREERSPSPAPLPPPPPPPPEPEIRPPIIQEIITHHRHIDHGVERARSPTPPPPPPSPPRDETLEIAIRRKESRGGGLSRGFEEDIVFSERETTERRGRSLSAPRRRFTAPPEPSYADSEFEMEADFYNGKALERAYPGEAWNGATKDWAIVDVPPGTNRVRMEGIGGGAQEITWQRYNGVRRSKFVSGNDEHTTDFGPPAPRAKKDMWTEITKDLVVREAIDACGYDCEETDDFFYVMEYLRYEDVLRLVEISDDIRRRRKSRIREIEFERETIRAPRRDYDERFYEREVSYDRHRHRGGFR